MTWGRVLLWLVLGLSLFANAVVLGLALRFGLLDDGASGLRSAWGAIPAETRADFRAGLAANRAEIRGLVADLRAARAAMLEAAAARPYDRTAVMAAQARLRVATEALQVTTHRLMLEAFDRAAGEGNGATGAGGP